MAQATEHTALFFGGLVELLVIRLAEEPLIASNGGLGDDFKEAAGGDFDKARIIGSRRAGASFGDIGGNGNGCPAHLVGQAEAFRIWKAASQLINQVGKCNCFMPGIELLKVKHAKVLGTQPSTINTQPGCGWG